MRDFLAISDLTPDEFRRLIKAAVALKQGTARGPAPAPLANRTLGMIFQKPSLRTRVSFDVAMLQLGGHALYLSPQEIGLGQRESVADVARVLERYVNAIMARVFSHSHVVELARYSSVPVINGLSDLEHPCQAFADLLTVYEKRGKLEGLRLAYLGDGNNVARSLMFACVLSGMDFAIASPAGYHLDAESVTRAGAIGDQTGGRIHILEDPSNAARNADVLYTDVWASMGQEDEAAVRALLFPPFQLNKALLKFSKPDALVMHCLPAHRGLEITDEVMDGEHSVVFDQAENRLHAQKAILVELLNPNSIPGRAKGRPATAPRRRTTRARRPSRK